jgi:hypothetical protein
VTTVHAVKTQAMAVVEAATAAHPSGPLAAAAAIASAVVAAASRRSGSGLVGYAAQAAFSSRLNPLLPHNPFPRHRGFEFKTREVPVYDRKQRTRQRDHHLGVALGLEIAH